MVIIDGAHNSTLEVFRSGRSLAPPTPAALGKGPYLIRIRKVRQLIGNQRILATNICAGMAAPAHAYVPPQQPTWVALFRFRIPEETRHRV
jgi:hypothetical protein